MTLTNSVSSTSDTSMDIVVDTHCHIGRSENSPENSITGESLIAGMDKFGITHAIVLPLPSVHDFRGDHDAIAEMAEQHPGRIFGCVCVPAQEGSAVVREETRRCVEEYGFVALKFHPFHHGGGPASVRGDMVFSAAREFDIPVMSHTGSGAPWSLPTQLIPAAQKYPEVNFIAAHSGQEIYADDALLAAKTCENIYLDSAWTSAGPVNKFIKAVGADRVMLSTDLPANNATEMAKWRHLPITPEQRIESLNTMPRRLFKLDEHGFDDSIRLPDAVR